MSKLWGYLNVTKEYPLVKKTNVLKGKLWFKFNFKEISESFNKINWGFTYFELLSFYRLTHRHYNRLLNLTDSGEYNLLLSCTQVACENSFRRLKIIKNRLISWVKKKLEALMLMSIEKYINILVIIIICY